MSQETGRSEGHARPKHALQVGDWTVQPDRYRLARGGEQKIVRPQVMNMLVYLASRPGEVATTEELMRDLWPGRIVTQATLYNCIAELRAAVDDHGGRNFIETIPKRGYRLSAPVRGSAGSSRPSIAVLPFSNRSDDPSDAYFAEGIHDELISKLGNIRELLVISRSSVLSYRDTRLSVPEIARQLAVSAVMVGSVQRAGRRIHVNVQLINAASEARVWSREFDEIVTVENLFAIQSRITLELASLLAAVLKPAEIRRIEMSATDNLEAYSAVLRGDERFNRNNLEGWQQAETYFRRAVSLDPEFSVAWQRLADAIIAQLGTFERGLDAMWEAMRAADRAIELDHRDGLAWMTRGRAEQTLIDLGEKTTPETEMLEYFERAVDLAPGDARVVREYGRYLHVVIGDPERGTRALMTAIELDPMSGSNYVALGRAHREVGRYADALAAHARALALQPDNPYATWETGVTYMLMGRLADGLAWCTRALEFDRDDPTGPYLVALGAVQIGDLELAEAWYERGMQLNAEFPVAVATRLLLDSAAGHIGGLASLAEQLVADSAEARMVFPFAVDHALAVLRDRDLDSGEPENSEARYRQAAPCLFARSIQNHKMRPFVALDIAYLFLQSHDKERGSGILKSLRHWIGRMESSRPDNVWLWWWKIEASLLAGERRAGLLLMDDFPVSGWLIHWPWIQTRPVLDCVREAAEFQQLQAHLEAHRAVERRRFAKLSERLSPPGR